MIIICDMINWFIFPHHTDMTWTLMSVLTGFSAFVSFPFLFKKESSIQFLSGHQADGEHMYNGVAFMKYNSVPLLDRIKEMPLRPQDVILVTYPKAGWYPNTTYSECRQICIWHRKLQILPARYTIKQGVWKVFTIEDRIRLKTMRKKFAILWHNCSWHPSG